MSNTIGYVINESNIPGFTETNIIAEDRKGRLVAEAILQVADEVNRNRRKYPYDELIPQLTAPRTLELLEAGYFVGEMGHPVSNDLTRQQTLDGTRAAVQFLKLWHEGPVVKGTYRGTNNAYGQSINEDLKDGCKPAFSLRALGTVEKEGDISIVRNLKMIGYDTVIYPSHPSAYTQRIISESATISEDNYLPRLQEKFDNLYSEEYKDQYKAVGESGLLIPITNQGVIDLLKHDSKNIKSVKEMFDFAYTDMYIDEDGTKATLVDKDGLRAVISLEQHIHNEIMDYATQQKSIRDNL